MKIKILSPVTGYNGISAGVSFIKGEAEVDAEHLPSHVLEWFEAKGYQVIRPAKKKADKVVEIVEVAEETPE